MVCQSRGHWSYGHGRAFSVVGGGTAPKADGSLVGLGLQSKEP